MGSLKDELERKFSTEMDRLYLLGLEAHKVGHVRDLVKALRSDNRLLTALAQWFIEDVIAPDVSGAALSSARGGHYTGAVGQPDTAAPHGPVESGGASVLVPEGQFQDAPPLSSTITLGPDQPKRAFEPGGRLAGRIEKAEPREPRGRDAIAKVQRAINASLFDVIQMAGRPIGDLIVAEFRREVERHEALGSFGRELLNRLGPTVDPSARLRDVVKRHELWGAYSRHLAASGSSERFAEEDHVGH